MVSTFGRYLRDYFLKLVAHEAWANQKLLAALVKETSVAQRARDTFAHICSTPEYWLRRVQGEHIKEYQWWPPFDAATLEKRIQSNEQIWVDYLNSLPEPVEEFKADTISQKGDPLTFRAVDILTQYHNHSCHHRGQIAVLFRAEGIDPVVTDYIVWTRTIEQ